MKSSILSGKKKGIKQYKKFEIFVIYFRLSLHKMFSKKFNCEKKMNFIV